MISEENSKDLVNHRQQYSWILVPSGADITYYIQGSEHMTKTCLFLKPDGYECCLQNI